MGGVLRRLRRRGQAALTTARADLASVVERDPAARNAVEVALLQRLGADQFAR